MAAGVPVLALIAFVPYLLATLGLEQFGILSLILAVLAYASVLNFGLGKAVTQRVSSMLQTRQDEAEEVNRIVWTASAAQLAFGLLGGLILFLLAEPIASALNLEPPLASSTTESFQTLALALPLVLVTTTFRGLLQADGRFALVAAVDAPVGLMLYSLPALVVSMGGSVSGIVVVLVLSRLLALVAYYIVSVTAIRVLRPVPSFSSRSLSELMRFGVWVAVVDAALPLFAYLDRFVVGAFVGVAKVPFYSIPQDVVNRLWLFPTSIVNALFPAASALSISRNRGASRDLYARAGQLMAVTVLVGASIAWLFAYDVFALWISAEFAAIGTPVFQVFLAGFAVNSLAMVGSTLLLSQGKSRLRASILLFEVPVYIAALVLFLPEFGVLGAAIAWSLRMATTFFVVQVFVYREFRFGLPIQTDRSSIAILLSAMVFAVISAAVGSGWDLGARLALAIVGVLIAVLGLLKMNRRGGVIDIA